MKKSAIALTLFAVLGATVSSANAASTGTITFNGELTATTCDAVVDNRGCECNGCPANSRNQPVGKSG